MSVSLSSASDFQAFKKNSAVLAVLPSLAAWIYVVALAVFLALVAGVGERFWFTAVALYAPPTLWFVPALVLLPLSLLFSPRAALVQILCVLALAFFWMPYRWSQWPPRKNDNTTLTFVTNNIGQNNHQSLAPFLDIEQPDIIALQDAAHRGGAFQRAYPDRFVVERDEFILISKYPIRRATILPAPKVVDGRPVAAVFEVGWANQPLVIYNVHMPTPRSSLEKIMGKGLLLEMLGRNAAHPWDKSMAQDMVERVELARALAKVFDEEKRPFLVMGDFNAPDQGYIHRLFASHLVDAFEKSGRGFGWTLPGDTHNPLSLFGPWIRIDYLFAGRGWKPVYARTEPARRSQHRAVVARFEMVK